MGGPKKSQGEASIRHDRTQSLGFPGMDLTLISTLGALRKLCIGLPSSLQLSPCCLDS